MASGKTETVFARNATGLVKSISGFEAMVVALSGMGLLYAYNIIVYTPGSYPNANPLLTQFGGFLVSIPIAAMYTFLAIAIARTGGDYVWVGRTLHPIVGFVTNFSITLISLSFIGSVTPQAVQWAGTDLFYDLGKIQNNQSYLNIATGLSTPTASLVGSVIIILIAAGVVLASSKLATRVVKYWTIAALVIGAIFVITVLYAGSSTFVNNFNAMSGSNYNQIVSAGVTAGATNGAPPLISYNSFYAGAAVGALSFLAFFYPAYFAGEVKQNRRTQITAQIGGMILFTIFTTIIAAVEYYGEGPAFANSMASLFFANSSSFPYIGIPLASGMSMFWTQNTVLVSLFNVSYALTIFAMDVAILFTLSRNLFAWSFDRLLPTSFASVNRRTRTPALAIGVMTIIALGYLVVSLYTNILASLFSYGVAGLFIAFILVGITAIVFPFVRKDIFSTSESPSRSKIGGIPVISILGVLSIIASIVVAYSVFLGPVLSGNFAQAFFEGIIPTFVVGIIIYLIAWAARKSQGIDVNLIQKEIPPE